MNQARSFEPSVGDLVTYLSAATGWYGYAGIVVSVNERSWAGHTVDVDFFGEDGTRTHGWLYAKDTIVLIKRYTLFMAMPGYP
jgi:hypothetical protein